MRLENFILEMLDSLYQKEMVVDMLEKDCQSVIKMLQGTERVLWRGSYGFSSKKHGESQYITYKITPRQNRGPLNTAPIVHEAYDKFFLKKFGWKARSEGVFCSGSRGEAALYGNPAMIFPIGNFKFIWSPRILDLYTAAPFVHKKYIDNKVSDIMNDPWFRKYMPTYKNTDFRRALAAGNEIMLKCKEYYLVHSDMRKNRLFLDMLGVKTLYGV